MKSSMMTPRNDTEPFDLAETDRLLTTTRSVRKRLDLDRPVPPHLIEDSIEIALQAPTAEGAQSWRWLVITEPERRKKIADVFQMVWRFHQTETSGRASRRRNSPQAQRMAASVTALGETIDRVPVLVVPCLLGPPPNPATLDRVLQSRIAHKLSPESSQVSLGAARLSSYYGSIYPAIWSFQLALRSRGLGSTISCLHLPFASMVAKELGVPRSVTQICLLPVAYTIGTTFRPAQRTPARKVTYWEHWDQPATFDVDRTTEHNNGAGVANHD